jgi:hypothetical protein
VTFAEEATMMTMNMRVKKILGHQRDIQRYCRLLATDLTDLERQYLNKRTRKSTRRWIVCPCR